MGQYYVPTLVDENEEMKTFYSHAYDNGLKLMEHSYIGNNFVAAVLHELVSEPHRVWWLGDYAEMSDFKNDGRRHKLYAKDRKKAWSDKCNVAPTTDNQIWDFDGAYLINLDMNCYIRLEANNSNELQICPLPLLTAVGNGKGGGDYRSDIGIDDVGTWAGDRILVQYILEYEYKQKFTDATKDYYFKEEW